MADPKDAKKENTDLRAISVAEFFEKNRHLLGFDNPIRALLTSVKEAVDNSLDACETGKVLPDIFVQIQKLGETRFKMVVEDNGPGIPKQYITGAFGKLLYGSKFRVFGGKQSRGQQGIGISAAVLYGQLTSGKPARVISKTKKDKQANVLELKINVQTNEPEILSQALIDWKKESGTRVEIEMEAKYMEKKASVIEYIKETAIVNPHASITYVDPEGQKSAFKRVTNDLPKEPQEIKPHPHGIELGLLLRMLKETSARALNSFLISEFDKVGSGTAEEILKTAGLDPKIGPKFLTVEQADKLIKAMHGSKVMSPTTTCLVPISAELLMKALQEEYELEFVHAVTRTPSVYRGSPFLIEVAVGYGGEKGELPADQTVKLFRFANRVPLLYQQGACALTKSVTAVDWKNYGLQQSGDNMPVGPAIILVHIASVWAPFTSESKEAIAHYDEIIKEAKLALQEVGRALQLYVGKKQRKQIAEKKADMFKLYGAELAEALSALTGKDKDKIQKQLDKVTEEMLKLGAVEGAEEEKEEEKKPKRKLGAFKGDDKDE
jgi:DNA topoisomerase-6 subunit B